MSLTKILLKENTTNKNVIYHFTQNLDSLLYILDSDSLQSGSFNKMFGMGYDNISFTWNPDLWDIEYVGDEEDRYTVRISFDYSKISNEWNFKEFNYGIAEEQEEIVEEDEMNGILKYVTEILISSEESKMEIENIKKRYPQLNVKVINRK